MTVQIPQIELDLTEKAEQTVKPNKSRDGRVKVSKKAWACRIALIASIIAVMVYNFQISLIIGDPIIIYSTLMPMHALIVLIVGWFFFKNKSTGEITGELVSVIIPVYNQEKLIEKVVDAVFKSTYANIEVIAVNDGSKDKTLPILQALTRKYYNLKVIQKLNGGKRTAVAAGFYASQGKYVVLIDSDSIVNKYAIEEFMRTFSANPRVGGIAGNGKVLNANKNTLTKCQDVWYDSAFNIHKTTESTFGTVLCCSGCLAAYRREAIAPFIPFWSGAKVQMSDDRDLTTYVTATSWARKEMTTVSQQLREAMANYDDSEDRGLTSQALDQWETVYVPTAIVYTEVPEKIRPWLRQQTRWRKGYLRSCTYISCFFWRKNPLMSLIFYTEFMQSFISPLLFLYIYGYMPLFLNNYMFTLAHLGGQLLIGLGTGLDYKFREPVTKNWVYKPLMGLLTFTIMPWLLFPALWTYKKNLWLTR